MSSLSSATVFRVSGLRKHENADSLMVGEFEGCPYIVNMNDTKENDLRIFVPFDMVCPNENWVGEFVRGKRVRPMRLRGVFSMGVCLPLPECVKTIFIEGQDVTELLGFTKWEPPEFCESDGISLENSKNGYSCGGPSGLVVTKYDLESIRKYHRLLCKGEEVYITAKLHGENFLCVYWQDRFHVKSRNRWIVEGDNKWWESFRLYDWSFLKDYPGICLLGEKYGNVNKFRYDCSAGQQRIRIFDLYDATKGNFFPLKDFLEFSCKYNIETVPMLYRGPWMGLDYHKDLVEGKAVLGGDIEEGYVCEPVKSRYEDRFGRIKLKFHSERFLLHQGKLK